MAQLTEDELESLWEFRRTGYFVEWDKVKNDI